MVQNLNLLPSEPQLKDLLNFFGKQLKLEMNCHHIGTIQLFNPIDQTAEILINYTKTYQQLSSNGNASIVTVDYPMLVQCPVICLGGGLGSLTFPITTGDECILFFNDRDIDNWFNGSSSAAPNTPRLHAFPDAIALVGVRSLAKVLTSYSTTAVTLTYGVNTIQIFANKVLITVGPDMTLEIDATGSVKLTNSVGEFFTALYSALTTATAGGFPLIVNPTDLLTLQSFTL